MLTIIDTEVEYPGNGINVSFVITFPFFSNSHVQPFLVNNSGIESAMLPSEYSIVGNILTVVTAPAADEAVRIRRSTPRTQDIDYIDTGAFPAQAHENAMDKIVMMIQELDSKIVTLAGTSVNAVAAETFSYESTQILSSSGAVVPTAEPRSIIPVIGNSAAATSCTIGNGTSAGQEMVLLGMSDDYPVEIIPGATVKINGACTLNLDDTIVIIWNGSKWIETTRS
jgi:hypothetical protein